MAAPLILAKAANRKIDVMGKRGQSVEHSPVFGSCHFRFVTSREAPPSGGIIMLPPRPEKRCTRREVRQPDIEPVVARIPVLPDASRRPPDRAQSDAFSALSGRAETDDPDRYAQPRERFAFRRSISD